MGGEFSNPVSMTASCDSCSMTTRDSPLKSVALDVRLAGAQAHSPNWYRECLIHSCPTLLATEHFLSSSAAGGYSSSHLGLCQPESWNARLIMWGRSSVLLCEKNVPTTLFSEVAVCCIARNDLLANLAIWLANFGASSIHAAFSSLFSLRFVASQQYEI